MPLNYDNKIDPLSLADEFYVSGHFDSDDEIYVNIPGQYLTVDDAKALYAHLDAILGDVEDPAEIEEEDDEPESPLTSEQTARAVATAGAAQILASIPKPSFGSHNVDDVIELAEFILGVEDDDEPEATPAEVSVDLHFTTEGDDTSVTVQPTSELIDDGSSVFIDLGFGHTWLTSDEAARVRDTITAIIG